MNLDGLNGNSVTITKEQFFTIKSMIQSLDNEANGNASICNCGNLTFRVSKDLDDRYTISIMRLL